MLDCPRDLDLDQSLRCVVPDAFSADDIGYWPLGLP